MGRHQLLTLTAAAGAKRGQCVKRGKRSLSVQPEISGTGTARGSVVWCREDTPGPRHLPMGEKDLATEITAGFFGFLLIHILTFYKSL